jgi:hypothetical protein
MVTVMHPMVVGGPLALVMLRQFALAAEIPPEGLWALWSEGALQVVFDPKTDEITIAPATVH